MGAVSLVLMGAIVMASLEFEPYEDSCAICNDKTPSGLYFQKATAEAQNDVWVVQMQGGGWCWDPSSCAKREGDLISSKNWEKTKDPTPGSILAATGTDFEHANKAYQAYCTSDGYIGNTSVGGMEFRGHAVVLAMLQKLQSFGMGATKNSTLIFSGCSAGGRGVLHNLNRAADIAKGYGVKRFVALIDSGLYIDTEPLTGSVPALQVQAKGVVSYLHAAVDPTCARIMKGDETQYWKCLIGEYAVPTLRAPFILHAFQADRFQLGFTDFGNYLISASHIRANQDESAYADAWRNRTRAALQAAATAGAAAGGTIAIHSSDCYSHCNTEGAGFSNSMTVNGISLKSVTQSFVFGTTGPTELIDNCTGEFACGAGCTQDDNDFINSIPSWLMHSL